MPESLRVLLVHLDRAKYNVDIHCFANDLAAICEQLILSIMMQMVLPYAETMGVVALLFHLKFHQKRLESCTKPPGGTQSIWILKPSVGIQNTQITKTPVVSTQDKEAVGSDASLLALGERVLLQSTIV